MPTPTAQQPSAPLVARRARQTASATAREPEHDRKDGVAHRPRRQRDASTAQQRRGRSRRSRRAPRARRSALLERARGRSRVTPAPPPARARRQPAQLPARAPDVDDQDVGADEEDRRAPWIISVRFAGQLRAGDRVGSSCRVDVPMQARRTAARRRRCRPRLLRPSSATAMPDEADRASVRSSIVVDPMNCQPRMSIAPASPANAPEIAIARK